MVKKDAKNRLNFERDFFESTGINLRYDLVFALTATKNLIIITTHDFDYLNDVENENLELLDRCYINPKDFSFSLTENVINATGDGDLYYFSSVRKSPRKCSIIYIHKSTDVDVYNELFSRINNLSKRLEKIEQLIEQNSDDSR